MVNLKSLLTKMAQEYFVETGTPNITATKGTIVNSYYAKFRHVMFISLEFRNTSSIANGATVFEADTSNLQYKPSIYACNCTYYGKNALIGTIWESTLTIMNASPGTVTMSSTGLGQISFFYIVK